MKSRVRARLAGFTLVELMIVVAIATILFAIAVPSYMSQVRQSRRTEAKTALLDLAGREESFMSTNGSAYTNAAATLGYSALPATTPNGYYTLTVAVVLPLRGRLSAATRTPMRRTGPPTTSPPPRSPASARPATRNARPSRSTRSATSSRLGTLTSAQCWAQ